jgi:hypothetical protein
VLLIHGPAGRVKCFFCRPQSPELGLASGTTAKATTKNERGGTRWEANVAACLLAACVLLTSSSPTPRFPKVLLFFLTTSFPPMSSRIRVTGKNELRRSV